MRNVLLWIALGLLASGCVAKSRYNALKNDNAAMLEENRAMAERLGQCEADVQELVLQVEESKVMPPDDAYEDDYDDDYEGEDEPMEGGERVPGRGPKGNRF